MKKVIKADREIFIFEEGELEKEILNLKEIINTLLKYNSIIQAKLDEILKLTMK